MTCLHVRASCKTEKVSAQSYHCVSFGVQVAGCPAPIRTLYIRMLPRTESFPTIAAQTPYEVCQQVRSRTCALLAAAITSVVTRCNFGLLDAQQ